MLEIRKYQDSDLLSLNKLLKEAYQEFGFTRKGKTNPLNQEFVAIVDNQVVGYLVLNQLYDQIRNINYGHINYVCVLKKYQNRGVATELFQHVFNVCKKEQISYLELTSNPTRVAAHHLYQKLEFQLRKTDVFRKEII